MIPQIWPGREAATAWAVASHVHMIKLTATQEIMPVSVGASGRGEVIAAQPNFTLPVPELFCEPATLRAGSANFTEKDRRSSS
jgi:hypothetical protein